MIAPSISQFFRSLSFVHIFDTLSSLRHFVTSAPNEPPEGRSPTVNINLSLHYLGQVIEALHSRAQGTQMHVPYRNSLMTSVLRDSLGGNCKTLMVGAIAVEEACIDETISTCRFATRVASIKNNANINEELDPNLLIKKLKKEVDSLKSELRLMQGQDEGTVLSETDCRCH